jgi:hypothetical protein
VTRVTVVVRTKLPLVPVTVIVEEVAGVVRAVVSVITVDPGPTSDVGAKLALVPAGIPLAVKLTLPLNPPTPATVTVYAAVNPTLIVWDEGIALSEKSELTTRVAEVVCVRLGELLVPVMVSGYVPAGVVASVVTVRVDVPEPATEGGLNGPDAPAGSPVIVRFTVPEKPPDFVTVTV